MAEARRAGLALLTVVVVVLGGGERARAQSGDQQLLVARRVAAALGSSPLYVAPALADSVRPAAARAILRAIAAAPRPVFVVLVPLVPGDSFGGDSNALLAAVHARLGRDGIYLTVVEDILTARDFGHDDELALLADGVANEEAKFHEPATTTVTRFLSALVDPGLQARYDRDHSRLFPPEPATARRKSGGGWALPLILVLAGLVLAGAIWRYRRSARPAPRRSAELPRKVFADAKVAADHHAREEAQGEALALAEALAASAVPQRADAQEAYGRALDASAAAQSVLDHARGTSDLVGALVLAQDGRAELAAAQAREAGRQAPEPEKRCALDPRHGPAAGEGHWGDLELPVCRSCMAALKAGRAPDALLDDGKPYLEGDTVWARTAFGALDDLLGRVARGER